MCFDGSGAVSDKVCAVIVRRQSIDEKRGWENNNPVYLSSSNYAQVSNAQTSYTINQR